MLRVLLGEPPRKNSGVLADAMENMKHFCSIAAQGNECP